MNTKKRADIDFLKTIAIIAVILYHFFDIQKASSKNFNFSLFDGGFLGVDIFLVVSGFLITGSIVSKLYSSEFSILEFYKRRDLWVLEKYFWVLQTFLRKSLDLKTVEV